MEETITTENLVTGVLEECFREMDDEIRHSLSTYDITGGCICLVVLIMLGKVYVTNAGDCRAILVRKKEQREEGVYKIPMVIGRDKRARLLSTIGTMRGFGDHDLTCQSGMYIIPS